MRLPFKRTSLAICLAAGLTAHSFAAEFKVNGRTFNLPDGFTIELIAGPPLVDRPIVADFDEQGRLYVADSSGSNENVNKQVVERPHRIVRLEDKNGDGKFESQTVFADKMMFPEGAMWRDGSLYVSAPPSIWKLTDTNNDGVADERVEWFKGKTLTGCANDLHGPYNGPDGWIYWCKGAFAEQTYPREAKPPFVTKASHIFRCRPDGSGIEPVMTGGMDNPVDVVFTPEGERIFTTTFLQNPGGGKRDGLIHAIYGGVYGKIHSVIDSHPQTGPEVMPVLSHLGPAAPCGLTRYTSNVFGNSYRDNLFACQFNLRKVSRHLLKVSGSALASSDLEFLSSPDIDFHPTDVNEDADGSLIVVDTGGWYKLCCPTSQLEKPDVLGGIYRVRRIGTPKIDDPRGREIEWAKLPPRDLAKLLDDPRHAVRRHAVATLALAGAEAVAVLEPLIAQSLSIDGRRNAVWTLARINTAAARKLTRQALRDESSSVQETALHAISLWRDKDAIGDLIGLLNSQVLTERRLAAEALGRIGDPAVIPSLLDAASQPNRDRSLSHAITYALIEIGDTNAIAAGLARKDPNSRRAAMIALDQLGSDKLPANLVVADLNSSSVESRQIASWIVARHPAWAPALESWFAERLNVPNLSDLDRHELESQLAQFAKTPAIESLITKLLTNEKTSPATTRSILKAMAASGQRKVPEAWIDALAKLLDSHDLSIVANAVTTTRSLNIPAAAAPKLAPKLLAISERIALPLSMRLEALAAAPGGLATVPRATFTMLCEEVASDRPVSSRQLAAQVLASTKLSPELRPRLISTFAIVGPLELDRLISPFEALTDDETGMMLVDGLMAAPARQALRTEAIKPHLAKFSPKVQEHAKACLLYTSDAADD